MYETNQTLLGGLIECERETGKGVMNGEIMKEREGGLQGGRGASQRDEHTCRRASSRVYFV